MRLEPSSANTLDFSRLMEIAGQNPGGLGAPKKPPRRRSDPRALTLTVLAHSALAAFLLLGLQWQSVTPEVIEADLWAPSVRQAAPKPVAPSPPEPKPEPAPAPPPMLAPAPPPEVPDPDIALEKKAREQAVLKAKVEAEKKVEKERLAQEQAELEQQKRDEALKAKQEKDRLTKAKAEQDKRFEQDRQRLIASAGTAAPESSGAAASSASPRGTAEWAGRVRACVQPNVNFPVDTISGNPASEFAIERLPDGSVGNVRVLRSGGVAAFDAAVERAIRACGSSGGGFPKPPDGQKQFQITYRPKSEN